MRNELTLSSNDNALFVTAQCNNHCIMCCQPPTKKDNINYFFERNLKIIRKAPKDLQELALTGGEPTIMGDRLFDLIQEIQKELPNTAIHILTNGRKFVDHKFVKELADVGNGQITVGIPLHSDYERDHDMIAGCIGAYKETILGLYNAASEGIGIELRIVINSINHNRLPHMADFIFKNLSFVSWTAFMGMERTGLASKNSNIIWIEPLQYVDSLNVAVKRMADWNMNVEVYNLPLCILPESLHSFAQKSISDWKNLFLPFCKNCIKKNDCSGLFETSKIPFEGLHPITF